MINGDIQVTEDGADLWDIDEEKKADLAGEAYQGKQIVESAELDSSLDFKMTFNQRGREDEKPKSPEPAPTAEKPEAGPSDGSAQPPEGSTKPQDSSSTPSSTPAGAPASTGQDAAQTTPEVPAAGPVSAQEKPAEQP